MKPSPFITRFFFLIILFAALIGSGVWIFMDQVLAKSFYYKFGQSELVASLATGALDMSRDTLSLQLDDTLFVCTKFNRKNPASNRFEITTFGDTLNSDASIEDLSSRALYVVKKAPELGVRRIRSEYKKQLIVQIRSSVELVWVENPSDKPAETKGIRYFDEHWYMRKKPAV